MDPAAWGAWPPLRAGVKRNFRESLWLIIGVLTSNNYYTKQISLGAGRVRQEAPDPSRRGGDYQGVPRVSP